MNKVIGVLFLDRSGVRGRTDQPVPQPVAAPPPPRKNYGRRNRSGGLSAEEGGTGIIRCGCGGVFDVLRSDQSGQGLSVCFRTTRRASTSTWATRGKNLNLAPGQLVEIVGETGKRANMRRWFTAFSVKILGQGDDPVPKPVFLRVAGQRPGRTVNMSEYRAIVRSVQRDDRSDNYTIEIATGGGPVDGAGGQVAGESRRKIWWIARLRSMEFAYLALQPAPTVV